MKKLYVLSALVGFLLILSVALPAKSYSAGLDNRLQFEGSFATALEGDAGFNLNMNYEPKLPGVWDRTVAVGAFWQWTFDGDEIGAAGSSTDVSKVGGEVRLQKAFLNNSLVPYIKGEAGWLRFDNGISEDKFAAGPGFGVNYWITNGFGFGSEFNTVFVEDSGIFEDQITTVMVGPRVRF